VPDSRAERDCRDLFVFAKRFAALDALTCSSLDRARDEQREPDVLALLGHRSPSSRAQSARLASHRTFGLPAAAQHWLHRTTLPGRQVVHRPLADQAAAAGAGDGRGGWPVGAVAGHRSLAR